MTLQVAPRLPPSAEAGGGSSRLPGGGGSLLARRNVRATIPYGEANSRESLATATPSDTVCHNRCQSPQEQKVARPQVQKWLAAAVTVVALAGCASRSTPAVNSASDRRGIGSEPAPTAGADGTVTGVARVYGGPMMSNGSMAANGNPGQGIKVTAVRQEKVVASTVTGADGGFHFSLPPGSYVIRGCDDVTIAVATGAVTQADLSCQVP